MIEPEDEGYMRWYGIWRLQDEWSPDQHDWYWSQHIDLWPRERGRRGSAGLAAAWSARWLGEGYSQQQIARALGYGSSSDAPKALWRLAADYLSWQRHSAPGVKMTGPRTVAAMEFAVVRGVAVKRGEVDPDRLQVPYVLTDAVDASAPNAINLARRFVRRRWRSPRVVTEAEWEEQPYGMPEPYSEGILYSELDRARIERASVYLRGLGPHAAVPRAA